MATLRFQRERRLHENPDGEGVFSFETSDPRADERRRNVSIDGKRVTIARRLSGVRMKVVVPSNSYQGVVLSPERSGEPTRFALRLEHRDPDLSIPLLEAADSYNVIAEWNGWAQYLSLPRLVETAWGAVAQFDRSLGPLRVDAPSDRRSAKTVGARRPRFLACRRTGMMRRAPE